MLPDSVILYLTNKCKLNCSHCFLIEKGELNTSELAYSKVVNLLDDLAKNKVFMVAVTGGDPLLHKDVFKVLNDITNRGMLPLLGVSGIGITNEIAKEIKLAKVGCVQVSLDGASDLTNSIFRGKGSFNEIIDSIKILSANDIKVNLAICIAEENYSDFEKLISLAKDLNVFRLKVQFWKKYKNSTEFNELCADKKRTIFEYCEANQIYNGNEKWIYYPNVNDDDLSNKHNHALVIDADGSIKLSEGSKTIGNINEVMPSKCYHGRQLNEI